MAKNKKNIKKYYRFDMNIKTMNILASIFYVIFFIYLFANTYFSEFEFDFIALLGLFVYFGLHEICHGIGYALFAKDKKNIKFGVIMEKGVFYAMCQEEISRVGILVSLMFPIIILTILPLPFAFIYKNSIVLFFTITNLIGAIGDMLLAVLVLKLPKNITYIDFDNNIGAYFICDKDISNISSLGLKCEKSGEYDDKLIDTSIPYIYVSSSSKKFFIVFVIILILLLLINMI